VASGKKKRADRDEYNRKLADPDTSDPDTDAEERAENRRKPGTSWSTCHLA